MNVDSSHSWMKQEVCTFSSVRMLISVWVIFFVPRKHTRRFLRAQEAHKAFSSCPGCTQGVFFMSRKQWRHFLRAQEAHKFFLRAQEAHKLFLLVPELVWHRLYLLPFLLRSWSYIIVKTCKWFFRMNDLPERKWFGVSGSRSFESSLLYVKGRILRMASISVSTVCSVKSFRVADSQSITLNVVLILLINLSHTPTVWGASSGLNFHLISFCWIDFDIFKWSICSISFFGSLVAPTKLVPQSERIISRFPLRFMNLLRTLIKLSASSEGETSIWTTLVTRHVNRHLGSLCRISNSIWTLRHSAVSWIVKLSNSSIHQSSDLLNGESTKAFAWWDNVVEEFITTWGFDTLIWGVNGLLLWWFVDLTWGVCNELT